MKNKIEWSILGILIVGCFLLRVLGQLDIVFVDGQILFKEVDGWYHIRLAENMLANFPIPLIYDQFNGLGGSWQGFLPLMSWITAGLTKLGFNLQLVGAYLPPVVGSLCLVWIYLLGKELFKKGWIGLVACLLCTLLPSEFFHRSLLGFADHHILEVFFTLGYLYCIIRMEGTNKWRWAAGAGMLLSMYLLNWLGGLLLIGITLIWLLYKFIRIILGRESRKILWRYLVVFCIAGTICGTIYHWLECPTLYWGILYSLFLIPPVLYLLSKVHWRWSIVVFSLTLISLVPLLTWTGNMRVLINSFYSIFWGLGTTIGEADITDVFVAFSVYGISWLLLLVGIAISIKRKEWSLFLIWTLVLIFLTFGQRRWGYYFVIPCTLYATYFVSWIVERANKFARPALIGITCLFLLLPTVRSTVGVALLPNTITKDWVAALTWLEENTPEPFDTPNAYCSLDPGKPQYYVMTWWDYGHWVEKISRRPTLVSPTQQVVANSSDSKFYTYQTVEASENEIRGLRVKYVIIDEPMVFSKFYALLSRYRLITEQDVRDLHPNSTIVKLWKEEVPGYKVIYRNSTIKIYEVENVK